MKIILEDKAYVQLNDLAYLCNSDLPIPASIFMTILGGKGHFTVTDKNRYDFLEFNEDKDIEYLKKQTWMIDYNDIKDLNEKELMGLMQEIGDEHQKYCVEYNSYDPNERRNHQDLVEKCELIKFKFFSLKDFIDYKKGNLKIKLPKDVKKQKRKDDLLKVFSKENKNN